MNALTLASMCATALLVSWALTLAVRGYALRSNLLDQPNARSSHTQPTPRGGGLAIVLTFLPMLAALAMGGLVPARLAWAVGGAAALVAVIGFVDDRSHLSARLRFAGHTVAAAWLLWLFGAMPAVPVLGYAVHLGAFGSLLAGLYIVWSTNFYNFMDGIDGIASMQAVTVALAGSLLSAAAGVADALAVGLLLAACVAGFMVWNFPRARIFMGDAGSGFLGVVMAALALWHGYQTPALFWAWFILNGCFMVDATTTLVRRVRRGERFHEAHRSHAYQYAARRLNSHVPVTMWVGAINLGWLLPVAAAVALGHLDGALGMLLAYAPLLWLAFRLHAGDRAAQKE
jgi:Fuc2NAc and GlcNAc transferase